MAKNQNIQDRLSLELKKRKEENSFRKLYSDSEAIDFCSNDYLGFARSFGNEGGATGSRLISGNSSFCEALEKEIAVFHNAEAALIFNSGYVANIGLISTIANKGDIILYDKLVHASIRDGIQLSNAKAYSFRHNDLAALEGKLKRSEGNQTFIIVESLYSMDGDLAPLKKIVELADEYNANVIIDEAHSTGLFGENGGGYVQKLGLEHQIFARVHTYGKAMGGHGAVILGSHQLRAYLINFCRSFIYTTALPEHALRMIQKSYARLKSAGEDRKYLKSLCEMFASKIQQIEGVELIAENGPIFGILIPGNEKVKQVASNLSEQGFDAKAILSPTVELGKERLRICLHTFNSGEDVVRLLETLKAVI